jgi:nucleoside-triphosphatase THEP1
MKIYFVGREKKTKQIIKALKRGDNIILTGKYGIGRTSLIKHIADSIENRWRFIFVDFSQAPGRVCGFLIDELLPKSKGRKRGETLGYKSNRFRIGSLDFTDKRQPVLILDNIAKLSAQKLDLIRYFVLAKRFRFVAIVENFIRGDELFVLRARLRNALLINIPHLSIETAREYFRHSSGQHHFYWTESRINHLAEMTGGYPLGMKEVVNRKLATPKGVNGPVSPPKVNGP